MILVHMQIVRYSVHIGKFLPNNNIVFNNLDSIGMFSGRLLYQWATLSIGATTRNGPETATLSTGATTRNGLWLSQQQEKQ
jgi:hypothetical protein